MVDWQPNRVFARDGRVVPGNPLVPASARTSAAESQPMAKRVLGTSASGINGSEPAYCSLKIDARGTVIGAIRAGRIQLSL